MSIFVFDLEKETCSREKEDKLGTFQGRIESVSVAFEIYS